MYVPCPSFLPSLSPFLVLSNLPFHVPAVSTHSVQVSPLYEVTLHVDHLNSVGKKSVSNRDICRRRGRLLVKLNTRKNVKEYIRNIYKLTTGTQFSLNLNIVVVFSVTNVLVDVIDMFPGADIDYLLTFSLI